MVADLINDTMREWNQPLIKQLFEENIANEILAIPLSMNPKPDHILWTGNRARSFSVKSGYNRAYLSATRKNQYQASCSYLPPRNLWTQIWSLTEDQRLHGINLQRNIKQIDQWLVVVFQEKREVPIRVFIGLVLWQIWKARNSWIFRGKHPQPPEIIELAQNQSITMTQGMKNQKNKSQDQILPVRWNPPKNRDVKMNVDASWIPGEFLGSVAGIARDESGSVVEGFAAEVRASSASQAEAEALLHRIHYLKEISSKCVGEAKS
ncbi:uncharacterized protein LOC120295760 [Eucalyptus grandis]|uniref:uncharacterized protein LOC120295760 n=1 Tax=Eucalyptus grandis TaxID=71139 RepID=UPI00192EBC07|nr:uncharacterized protein LOC120295760 [Eucalyptus grandis]